MLPRPHGGRLIRRIHQGAERDRLLAEVFRLPRLNVNSAVASDIVNIGSGAFSPLEGFMGPDDLRAMLFAERLASGVPLDDSDRAGYLPPASQPTRENSGPVA